MKGIRLRSLKTVAALRCNSADSKFLSPGIRQHLFRNQDHLVNNETNHSKPLENTFQIPPLQGNIQSHVQELSERQASKYRSLLNSLALATFPPIPDKWIFEAGWTCYKVGLEPQRVEYPDEDALHFDAEVCVRASFAPVLATAVSPTAWYSWVSPALTQPSEVQSKVVCVKDLIPLGNQDKKPRVVIGHFVCYDSARIQECYDLPVSGLKFFDTMAAHVSVSGLTDLQRYFLLRAPNKPNWAELACGNSLSQLHLLYCGSEIDKSERDIFVKGTMSDIAERFQELCSYCALDVQATHSVFSKLFPLYLERFPHGATLSALLDMSSMFIPVTGDYENVMDRISQTSAAEDEEVKMLLLELAGDALSLMDNQKYRHDPWMWDQDWSVSTKKTKNGPNHPKWYKKFLSQVSVQSSGELDVQINFRKNIAAKLMQLCWGSFPLHHEVEHGWGMLLPAMKASADQENNVPVESITKLCKSFSPQPRMSSVPTLKDYVSLQSGVLASNSGVAEGQKGFKAEKSVQFDIQNGLVFKKLPHYISMERNVGGALSMNILTNSCLRSGNYKAKKILNILRKNIFWKRSGKLFENLPVVWFDRDCSMGAVVPSISVCGDFIRLPKEPFFSSLCSEPINTLGTDISQVMKAPEGWCFISANIPQTDIWMASLLADSVKGNYCSTPLGQMYVDGSLYSTVSEHMKMTVLQSALLVHAVLYGANKRYLAKMLREINPALGEFSVHQKIDRLLEFLCGCPYPPKANNDIVPKGVFSNLQLLFREASESKIIKTPILQSRLSRVLESDGQKYFSLIQHWLIRSSVADYLHVLMAIFRDLFPTARLCTVGSHDMHIKYLVHEDKKYQAAKSLHVAHLYAKAFCASQVGFSDVPQVAAELPFVTLSSHFKADVSSYTIKLTFQEALIHTENDCSNKKNDQF